MCGSFGGITPCTCPFYRPPRRLNFAFFPGSKYNCVGGSYGHNTSQQGTL